MILSDALSRRPDLYPETDDDNEDITMLPESLFVNLIDQELQKKIANSTNYEPNITESLDWLLRRGPSQAKEDLEDWSVEEIEGRRLIFYQGRNYIPNDPELRRGIVRDHHDTPSAGHPGELETYNAIRANYWWPGMRTFVKNYVKGCGTCQQYKINRQPQKPALKPLEGPVSP